MRGEIGIADANENTLDLYSARFMFLTCAFEFCMSKYNGYKKNYKLSYNVLLNLQLFLGHCHYLKDPYLRILVSQGPVFVPLR